MLINTEARGAGLSHIENPTKKMTTWVQIAKSIENSEDVYDVKRKMTCIDINHNTAPKIKSLMVELTYITKTIEEDSIFQPLRGLHSKREGSK